MDAAANHAPSPQPQQPARVPESLYISDVATEHPKNSYVFLPCTKKATIKKPSPIAPIQEQPEEDSQCFSRRIPEESQPNVVHGTTGLPTTPFVGAGSGTPNNNEDIKDESNDCIKSPASNVTSVIQPSGIYASRVEPSYQQPNFITPAPDMDKANSIYLVNLNPPDKLPNVESHTFSPNEPANKSLPVDLREPNVGLRNSPGKQSIWDTEKTYAQTDPEESFYVTLSAARRKGYFMGNVLDDRVPDSSTIRLLRKRWIPGKFVRKVFDVIAPSGRFVLRVIRYTGSLGSIPPDGEAELYKLKELKQFLPRAIAEFKHAQDTTPGDSNEAYVVYEKLFEYAGKDLWTVCKSLPGSVIPFGTLLTWMLESASALAAVHEARFFHGQVSPRSVYLSGVQALSAKGDATAGRVMIGGTSSIRKLGPNLLLQSMDTSKFASECGGADEDECRISALLPELKDRTRPYFCPWRADVYCWGASFARVILYPSTRIETSPEQLPEGKIAEGSEEHRQELWRIVQRAISSDPGRRPMFRDIVAELGELRRGIAEKAAASTTTAESPTNRQKSMNEGKEQQQGHSCWGTTRICKTRSCCSLL